MWPVRFIKVIKDIYNILGRAKNTLSNSILIQSAQANVSVNIYCAGQIEIKSIYGGVEAIATYSDLHSTTVYIASDANTDITITGNVILFQCPSIQAKTLRVFGMNSLMVINCSDNQLTDFQISDTSSITNIDCSDNQLSFLDVSELTNLQQLTCYNNNLTALYVSGLSALLYLYCSYNPFLDEETASTNFSNSLETVSTGILTISGLYASTIKPIAESKGWSVSIQS